VPPHCQYPGDCSGTQAGHAQQKLASRTVDIDREALPVPQRPG